MTDDPDDYWSGAQVTFSTGTNSGKTRSLKWWHRSWWGPYFLLGKLNSLGPGENIDIHKVSWYRNLRWWKARFGK